MVPNKTSRHLREDGDELFFSFIVTNLPSADEHSIEGRVQKFIKGQDSTPQQEAIDIAGALVGAFPRRNSTERRGYALAQSFSGTSTGETTLELFFRVRDGPATRNLTAISFTLVYIVPGTIDRLATREEKTVKIVFGNDDGYDASTEINPAEHLPCSYISEQGVNGGKHSMHPVGTMGMVLITILSHLHTYQLF